MPTQPAQTPEDARRARFEAALRAHGIVPTEAEAADAFRLAAWMDDGVARLGEALPDEATDSQRADDSAADLSVVDAGARLRDGSLTSVALVEAHLQRISKRDPTYLAFYRVLADRAREAARRADSELASGIDRGPLHGIPVGIKDLLDIAGIPTTAGSRLRQSQTAVRNAAVVDRLLEGGAVIVGKLATYEFATVGPSFDTLYPPARNPWNSEHITGGSSSGCAVAVAGGMLRTTIGSDTGGSVRGPASYCGVVGLKPTMGLVDTTGSVELSPSLDHLGPMSATSAEAALTLDVLTGRTGDGRAASRLGLPIAGFRIAYARNWFAAEAQADVTAAMDGAASVLSELGAIVEQVELPDYPAIEVAAAAIIQREAFELHARDLAAHPGDYGRQTFRNLVSGALLTDAQVAEARRAGAVFRQCIDDQIFSSFDALITVCALTTALPVKRFIDGAAWTPMRTIGFNVSGHPVLALPIGLHDGLPMGMQIVGRHNDEAGICQIGDAFEHATHHSSQRPPVLPSVG